MGPVSDALLGIRQRAQFRSSMDKFVDAPEMRVDHPGGQEQTDMSAHSRSLYLGQAGKMGGGRARSAVG